MKYYVVFIKQFIIQYFSNEGPVWSWSCQENQCLKVRAPSNSNEAVSLSACRLFCDSYASLWPRINGNITFGNKLIHVNLNSIDVLPKNTDGPSAELIRKAGLVDITL